MKTFFLEDIRKDRKAKLPEKGQDIQAYLRQLFIYSYCSFSTKSDSGLNVYPISSHFVSSSSIISPFV